MNFTINDESFLTKSISSELANLLKELEADAKIRNAFKKYISEVLKAYERSSIDNLTNLLSKPVKDKLLLTYPSSKETFENLSVDIKRHSESAITSLYENILEYCNNHGLSLRGKMPRLIIDGLLEIIIDDNNQTAKVGTIFIHTLNWEKIQIALDRERQRIWGRPFDAASFRDDLLEILSNLLKIKANPVGWVRLEDVYRTLKKMAQEKNPNWKTGGRLVAYYKDEFSADLSNLWNAQVNRKIEYPLIEMSSIRDPRLSFKVVMPDGQIGSYGYIRKKKE